jgi:1-hydroxycarotenoid 3,4-desaturase
LFIVLNVTLEKTATAPNRTIIVGAGMAGLAASIALSSKGEDVTLLETRDYPGGKMREISSKAGGIDSGPTVFTMKYIFDELFETAGSRVEDHVTLEKADVLARHAWDKSGHFDLFADRQRSVESIETFFGAENAQGYQNFCKDAGAIFNTLRETMIGAQRPSPLELSKRIGFINIRALLGLKPLNTLWGALGQYFPDQRLQQLFGRYATYVGSSPYLAPATLMLIAHVEQEGVWFIKGGMHKLAKAMQDLAKLQGVKYRDNSCVKNIMVQNGKVGGVILEEGEILTANKVIYCGDVSALTPEFLSNKTIGKYQVPRNKRSLSALTWSMTAKTNGMDLHRHNVLFSDDYKLEFDSIFKQGNIPKKPTLYICAQDRNDQFEKTCEGEEERLLCLVNSPAFGDERNLSLDELQSCSDDMMKIADQCGLEIKPSQQTITQASQFEKLFPGSGGALYGRASHGWTASFARAGAETKISGLYLAGGSVHPGPGVPMATMSGMLAAEKILA